jgi:NAD(P)-dependent dehydrogenase (short-subunit alcohol dehydrogenase family)
MWVALIARFTAQQNMPSKGFTKAMAIEFGQYDIRINTICPTFILTELTQATFDDPEKRAWVERQIKLNRVGQVEDIMGPSRVFGQRRRRNDYRNITLSGWRLDR